MTPPVDRRTVRSPLPLVAALLGALTLGCGDSAAPAADRAGLSRPLRADTLRLALENGDSLAYVHGFVSVPLRRDRSGGPTIDVEFHRFRGPESSDTAPPIVLLRGGPGGDGLTPLLEDEGYFEALLAQYTRVADLIVPGQRGFGRSHPTPCANRIAIPEPWDSAQYVANRADALAVCRHEWMARGLDLDGFTVGEAAMDVLDLATALGIARFQLVGSSFGSHWGIAVLRASPKRVTRATFAAVEGPDHTFDRPSGVAAALTSIAEAAETSGVYETVSPGNAWMGLFADRIARAAAEPDEVIVALEGGVDTVSLGPAEYRALLHGYRTGTQFPPAIARWPHDLLALIRGETEAAGEWVLESRRENRLRDAAFYQMECSSGISDARAAELDADPAIALVGAVHREDMTVCDGWPTTTPPGFHDPFEVAVPTLIVQGRWDTSTPWVNAEELAARFGVHRLVEVPTGSHGVLREAVEDVEGFAAAFERWLRTGDWSRIPTRVELPEARWAPPR